ncbi:tail completion protein gp17 [Novosphingobium resinovorum]|uniref:tail completion protein gp17 n=1 Tax=Novosphingobium resinovorum TaxID=158500 RepID=UPI002ED137E2|nr:DUF3168 domain-containing protein [Novosphingobium resinovorum]
METALRRRLMDAAPVTQLTATWEGFPCIFWSVRPDGSPFPAIVLTLVYDDRSQNFAGFNTFRSSRVQIDCYALDYPTVAALREAVIAAVVPEPAAEIQGVRFLRAFINTVVDRGDQTDTGFVHRQLMDITVWHDA